MKARSYTCCFILSVCTVAAVRPVQAQDRCATVAVTQQLHQQHLLNETDDEFEKWITERKLRRNSSARTGQTYKIPVVVHIIHKGEALGSGTNIPDAQVISQIGVLNKDFNRLNADASSTPPAFAAVAASLNIEFVLAKQTPDGTATTGIVRVKGSKNQWVADTDNTALKAQSYWPAEDYLNIWVTDISSNILGYAQFPFSSGLAGLESAENNRLTDGVVIDYLTFGSIADGTFNLLSSFSNGRTATHEIGHFFGLRHIWGDDNTSCTGTDYVTDTPNQGGNTSGCPSTAITSCSGITTMFQNYMDYTNDACMNLFTAGQVSRMETVIDNSPRRLSLLTSAGGDDPAPVPNDIAITSVTSPSANVCAGSTAPAIAVVNNGITPVNTAKVVLTLNGQEVETKNVTFAPAVPVGGSATITFSTRSLQAGTHTLKVNVIQTNGVADGKNDGNEKTAAVFVSAGIGLPFAEPFAAMPAAWKIVNADNGTTWSAVTAPKGNASNGAVSMASFGKSLSGSLDVLFSPVFNLSGATNPYVVFDVAYAQYQNSVDGLKVYVMTDCSNDISKGQELYSKSGSGLATASQVQGAFAPSGESQWRNEVIELSGYIGQTNVQLAFVSISQGGNNLYLDNIAVTGAPDANIAITGLVTPGPVHCNSTVQPVIAVYNPGAVSVTSFKVTGTVNGVQQVVATASGLNVAPGAVSQVMLPVITLLAGNNTFAVTLSETNGFPDIDNTNNAMTFVTVVDTAADFIPLREKFDDGSDAGRWTIANPAGGATWSKVSTNYGQSLYFNDLNGIVAGDEAWLVSPVLNLSGASEASMFYNLSYVDRNAGNKAVNAGHLAVKVSRDCGDTYEVIAEGDVEALAAAREVPIGTPASASHWNRQYVNLSSLAGEAQLRIAFVLSNGRSNGVYLDNIEFFLSDNPTPLATTDAFVVYGTDPSGPSDFYVTFNLEDRQDVVVYDLIDISGKQVAGEALYDVLNQTFTIVPQHAPRGLYLFRLKIGNQYYATRIFL